MNKKLLTLFLAICMICTLIPFSAFAADSVETVSYEVTYNQSAARKMLKLINDFRTGDDAWYWNQNNRSKVYPDLKALTYDYTLEKVAMQRAAEIALLLDDAHTRPNGSNYTTLISKAYTASAENSAGGYNGYKEAFNGWLQTDVKTKYEGQAQRRNMLSADFNAVGIACVYYNDNYYWVQVFGKTETINTKSVAANDSSTIVNADVNYELIDSIKISTTETPIIIGVNKSVAFPKLTTTMILADSWPGSDCEVTPTYTWATSDRSIVKIANGKLVGVKEGTATVTATALGTSYSIPVQVTDSPVFKDVKSSDYYYNAVLWAVDEEITKGTDNTHFSPDKTCTRAEIVTFLWREAGCPAPKTTKCAFKDVDKNAYYYNAVLWAIENKITEGTDKTLFSPDKTCTRAEAVTFLWRAEKQPAVKGVKNPFKDVKSNDYYYNAVLWAVNQEITNGTDKTHFSPDQTCTRGQIVTFLWRK